LTGPVGGAVIRPSVLSVIIVIVLTEKQVECVLADLNNWIIKTKVSSAVLWSVPVNNYRPACVVLCRTVPKFNTNTRASLPVSDYGTRNTKLEIFPGSERWPKFLDCSFDIEKPGIAPTLCNSVWGITRFEVWSG